MINFWNIDQGSHFDILLQHSDSILQLEIKAQILTNWLESYTVLAEYFSLFKHLHFQNIQSTTISNLKFDRLLESINLNHNLQLRHTINMIISLILTHQSYPRSNTHCSIRLSW